MRQGESEAHASRRTISAAKMTLLFSPGSLTYRAWPGPHHCNKNTIERMLHVVHDAKRKSDQKKHWWSTRQVLTGIELTRHTRPSGPCRLQKKIKKMIHNTCAIWPHEDAGGVVDAVQAALHLRKKKPPRQTLQGELAHVPMIPGCLGRPTREGNTARGASSPPAIIFL